MSVVLTVCKVLPDVVASVATIVGVVGGIVMILAVGLASFIMSLGTCGCTVVAVVVAAVDGAGGMMLTVTGVLAIMVTTVEVTDAVVTGAVS